MRPRQPVRRQRRQDGLARGRAEAGDGVESDRQRLGQGRRLSAGQDALETGAWWLPADRTTSSGEAAVRT